MNNDKQNNNKIMPVIFGEVLFDCFPDGNSILGGAPFNVAWHLQAFNLSPLMVSSIGDDALGEKITARMKSWNMNTSAIQLDNSHQTGSVDVQIIQGEPNYTIVEHSAYDYINAEQALTAINSHISKNSFLYHGTLALRNDVSRDTLAKIKATHNGIIFLDVNLRNPWWQKNHVLNLATEADWVKLNEDELLLLSENKEDTSHLKLLAEKFINAHKLKAVIVTLGSKGAFVLTNKNEYVKVSPPDTLNVIDTVGAGDAFTSVLITGILLKWPLKVTMNRAQDFASLVVTQQGATINNHELYQSIISDWQNL